MIEVGETKTVGFVRFHRYSDTFSAQDCRDAGKRGKTCPRYSVDAWPIRHSDTAYSAFADFLIAVEGLSYEAGLEAARALIRANQGFHLSESLDKSIRVAPVTFMTVSVGNDHYSAVAEYGSFHVYDHDDANNEPAAIPPCHGGAATAVKRFQAFLREHYDALKAPDVRFRDILKMMQDAGVDYHYYCRMD